MTLFRTAPATQGPTEYRFESIFGHIPALHATGDELYAAAGAALYAAKRADKARLFGSAA